MDARITNTEATLLLPRSSAAERVEAIRLAAGRARDAALGRRIAQLAERILSLPARWRARAELRSLTLRELADIGLTPGDIDRVVDGQAR
ncbi:DUF1127 domain-containing protein [Siccirubricoccus sp. KC 17139]|uniref:DUF1127 domain-containing protein n=1 Tax=Siccirubricoccus soli TaxID=2899147 RepID=A0ABT1D9Q6_9PROT|nr:DUF1127 domain-containing protein [Siccirubricoccus soli]MCO6418636.1 DUF1127 domain-containing protein [Siccirubricoccus soli]MCP2684771.1 DUF1127 domain-containing protein [Siccirubricoccus soli]